ncbi:uncharacterized protein PHACADRAFT_206249 [Phanerochaete carnosa HHB-10118-sp]|uniref:Uncharacterized protein n=1 Tax=Phanerochaete carnosa (strain HHB-10118-sp) TaxID=650164 RepID=K5WKU7_PHACS|nr:uncharacterized protein PHACADRAFT_206249 [Phanerochaete carnosa HHB-10118-sp]EKM60040.1 hypothetical protein PHACADRAFT_206249 [Phanerochaete carnosa HHB-10118-sp]
MSRYKSTVIESQKKTQIEPRSIRDQFEHLLCDKKDAFDYNRFSRTSFSFRKEYPGAPNPVLRHPALGTIGLPLNDREVEALKSRSTRSSDKHERHAYELDLKQMSLASPMWKGFLAEVLKDVSSGLCFRLPYNASAPKIKLHKILLHPKGSRTAAHNEFKSSESAFARVLVIVPCEYDGGAVHVSHDGLVAAYDNARTNHFQTTVVAWYTGATVETKPISSGGRLALLYDVVNTAQCPAPSLPPPSPMTKRFDAILRAWNDDTGEKSPQKLLFVLSRTRANAKLSRNSLADTDAQKLAFFEILASKHGFNLGLAHAKCYVETYHALDDYGQKIEQYSDDSDYDEHDQDRELHIARLVDLDGKLITKGLDYDEYSDEGVPSLLSKAVIDDGHLEKENAWAGRGESYPTYLLCRLNIAVTAMYERLRELAFMGRGLGTRAVKFIDGTVISFVTIIKNVWVVSSRPDHE